MDFEQKDAKIRKQETYGKKAGGIPSQKLKREH